MDILENILPRGCVISPKARSAAGDIAQPRGSIFPIYPCHAHYITIVLSEKINLHQTFVTVKCVHWPMYTLDSTKDFTYCQVSTLANVLT